MNNDIGHQWELPDGTIHAVTVTRGISFTDFGLSQEVSVSDGVIVAVNIPDEIKSADEARSWAALLTEAAYELDRQAGAE